MKPSRPRVSALTSTPLALALLALSCGSPAPVSPEPAPPAPTAPTADASTSDASQGPDVLVHAVVDLPRADATQALSATSFDEKTRTLYALQDQRPRVVPLVASADYTTFVVGTPIPFTGRPEPAWDGEGLVRVSGDFVAVTVETEPRVERFDAAGAYVARIAVPARFSSQRAGNKGLESLAISPSERFLFTANEAGLASDGAASSSGSSAVRIVRRELATGTTTEHVYRTEASDKAGTEGVGVSELVALSDDELLVLERAFESGYGNTVRIFRVSLAGAADVSAVDALASGTPALSKKLVVDVGELPPGPVTHPATQPNPLLDNYEAMALGPAIAGGRRLLFVTSDDNARSGQVARVLVLAVRGL